MFGEDQNDSIVQRGIDEALACQDVLARAPVRPSLLNRAMAWIVASLRALTPRGGMHERPTAPAAPRRVV